MSVVLAGPDGVGKTTAVSGLAEKLEALFYGKIRNYHGHFGFFPEWSKVYNWIFRKENNNLPKEFPRKIKKLSALRGILSVLYYGLEHFLAWPWILYLKIKGNAVIFDRYFYDFVTLSTNSKIPQKLFWFLSKIINRPDLTFILMAKPETIYSRKKELSSEEIKRQSDLFQDKRISNLASNLYFVIVETP